MNSLNSVLLEGNLTRDPDLRYTPSGTAVGSFSLASNRSVKKGDGYEEEVSVFEIEAWSRLAETCNEHLKKGRGVRVVGRLKQDRWEQDGQSRSKVKIVAGHVEFEPKLKTEEKVQAFSDGVHEYADEEA